MALHSLFILLTTFLPFTLAASSGCNTPSFLPGLTHYRFGLKSSGRERSYSYHLPSSYDASYFYPIVLGFHGSSSIGAFFELDTKMSEKRYSGDKIMVYPNGVDGSWAGPSYHVNTSSTLQQDVQFVADVIADVKAKFCVDEERVFGVGMSNGGGFIGTLACSPLASALFTALASHSGAFYTDVNGSDDSCAPSKVVPLLEIHGAADTTVKYGGGMGDGGPLPPISRWLEWWAERMKCTGKIENSTEGGKVLHQSWTCGGRDGVLQHHKVEDLGHCWADTEPNISQLTVPQGPSVIRASEIVMQFFNLM